MEQVKTSRLSKIINYYEKYMFLVGVIGPMLFYMQGIKIFLNHSASDVSLTGFVIGLLSTSSWLMYGLLLKNKVLITANIVAVIGALFVVIGVLVHG